MKNHTSNNVSSNNFYIIIIIIIIIVTFIPIVIGALGTFTKGLIKRLVNLEIKGQVETIQTTALLRWARILRRVLETCCHSNSSERPSANADVKNSQGVVIIIIICLHTVIQFKIFLLNTSNFQIDLFDP